MSADLPRRRQSGRWLLPDLWFSAWSAAEACFRFNEAGGIAAHPMIGEGWRGVACEARPAFATAT